MISRALAGFANILRPGGCVFLIGLFLLTFTHGVTAQGFTTESLRIPMPSAGPQGLEALLVRPAKPGKYPLALLNHGSPRDPAVRPRMTAQQMLPELMEFARRGWAAAIVMRRGYGSSGGTWAEAYGSCNSPDYFDAGRASATDLKATIAALTARPDIDPKRVLAVGVSAGGFAVTALTADPPPGLVAAISFAGARGSLSADTVCKPAALVEAFHTFGLHSRVPMLWVFAENDHFFGPQIATQIEQAFTSGGGKVDFKQIAAFGTDGHHVFSAEGTSIWTPIVDDFLKQQNLQLVEQPLPLPEPPRLQPPANLSAHGLKAFETYLAAYPHKAFVVGSNGAYAWRTARRSEADARDEALSTCTKEGGVECKVYALDDGYAPDSGH